MPCTLRGAISKVVVACLALSAFSPDATAQMVFSGLGYSFTKESNTDATLPENQDRLTPDVWLSRDYTGGMLNLKHETEFVIRDGSVISPLLTEWATEITNPEETIAAANHEALAFDTWINAFGGSGQAGFNIVGLPAVLRLIGDEEDEFDDIYLDIVFTDWGQGGGGAFSYLRSDFLAGDYNDDGAVNAADYTVWRNTLGVAMPNGRGADGDLDGLVGPGDYDLWFTHFGETLDGGGSGSVSAVPEPSVFAIASGFGMLLLAVRRDRSSRWS